MAASTKKPRHTTPAGALRSAFRTIDAAGIQAVVTPPTCCAGCAETDIDGSAPYMVAVQADGRLNKRQAFQKRQPMPSEASAIYWSNGPLDDEEFMATVCEALTEVGFDVRRPVDRQRAIQVCWPHNPPLRS